MGTTVAEVIKTVQRMKKKEIEALEAAKENKSIMDYSMYYGLRIGMLDEVLERINALV